MRYRLQRHDGTDCSATMVPITVLRMVPIQRYRHNIQLPQQSTTISSYLNASKCSWIPLLYMSCKKDINQDDGWSSLLEKG